MGEVDKAYERALWFLERRERTEREVYERLTKAGFSEDAALGVLERLKDAGLVDDEGYAVRYMEALATKGRGRLRIAQEMRRKGLTDELVRNTLEDGLLDEDERERAIDAARKAWAAVPDGMEPRKAVAKVNRRLVTLGFSYSIIGEAMDRLRRECQDDAKE